MSIRKIGNTWYIHLSRGGVEIRKSAKTTDRAKAQELHDTLANSIWRQAELGEKPQKLWEAAVVQWVEHSRKRSLSDDLAKIRWLDQHLRGVALEAIDRDFWDGVLVERRKEGDKDATLNRYTALVKAILRQNGLRPDLRKYAETRRTRYLSPEEARSAYLGLPEWARPMFHVAIATGIRKANLLGLRWSWIDMARRVIRIPAEHFKQGRAVEIPLSSEAAAVIKSQIGKHTEFVFTRNGQPVTKGVLRHAWQKVAPPDCRFHDIRKSWATYLRQAGVSIADITEAGGWSSGQLVQTTYAHVRPAQLVENVDKLNGVIGEITADLQQTAPDEIRKFGAGRGT